MTYTDRELEELRKAGARVRVKKKAAPKKKVEAKKEPAPKPAAPPPKNDDFAQKAITMTAANISVSKQLTEQVAKLVDRLGEAPAPRPYQFVIKRDKNGRMESVDAKPL